MSSDPHPSRHRLTYLAIAGVVVLLLLGAVAAIGRLGPSARSAAAADDTVVGPPVETGAAGPGVCTAPSPLTRRQLRELAHRPMTAPIPLGTAQPARPALRALAASITADRCDTGGRYGYVQLRQWVTDTRADHGRTDLTTAVLQHEHWLAADGSGRATAVTTRTPAAENPPTDDTFPAGGSPIDAGPLPTDPVAAAARLNHATPLAAGPQAPLRAIADVNQWLAPGRDARAALLGVLRDTDGLTYHGRVADRAGRPGVAVAAISTNATERDLLIIDPANGNLLAHEETALHDPGKLGITAPTVLVYTLYITRDHTATVQHR
jgi:hypothetical protein